MDYYNNLLHNIYNIIITKNIVVLGNKIIIMKKIDIIFIISHYLSHFLTSSY